MNEEQAWQDQPLEDFRKLLEGFKKSNATSLPFPFHIAEPHTSDMQDVMAMRTNVDIPAYRYRNYSPKAFYKLSSAILAFENSKHDLPE